MSAALESVRALIADEGLVDPDAAVLVGLSGGVDSVVLVDMLHRLGYDVAALHVNYRLRGTESEDDERFVRRFCSSIGIPLSVETFDTPAVARDRKTSVQETARKLRYEAFEKAASAASISAVAVGHHRDDQAETVLLHLFRGTGPEGLAGMPVKRRIRRGADVWLVRPLLQLRRSELEAYAEERGLSWREDPSNLKAAYRRGALRAYVLPLIENHFGDAVTENIARSADLMRAYVESGLDAEIREAFSEASSSEEHFDAVGQLDVEVLQSFDPVMRRRIILEAIRRWLPALGANSATVSEIEKLLEAQPGRRLAHPTGTVWRERSRLLFTVQSQHPTAEAAALQAREPAETPLGTIEISMDVDRPEDVAATSSTVEYVDADRLTPPLIVRRWWPGDRFIPLGMSHAKKISDFLTDEKVPPHRKEPVLVLQAGEEIVWVIGYRIAETVRIRPETSRVARLRFHPAENT